MYILDILIVHGGGGSFIVSYEQCDYTQPWVLHLQKKKKKQLVIKIKPETTGYKDKLETTGYKDKPETTGYKDKLETTGYKDKPETTGYKDKTRNNWL